jgi:hypothetical protein
MTIRENTFPYSRESADGKDDSGKTLPLFPVVLSNFTRKLKPQIDILCDLTKKPEHSRRRIPAFIFSSCFVLGFHILSSVFMFVLTDC